MRYDEIVLKLWKVVSERPMEAIGFTVAALMFIGGFLIAWPNFTPPPNSVLGGLASFIIVKAIGLYFMALFGTHMYAICKNKRKIRKFCTYTAFITLFVFGLLNILIPQPGQNLNWVSTWAIAAVEGISYLRLKWGLDRRVDN